MKFLRLLLGLLHEKTKVKNLIRDTTSLFYNNMVALVSSCEMSIPLTVDPGLTTGFQILVKCVGLLLAGMAPLSCCLSHQPKTPLKTLLQNRKSCPVHRICLLIKLLHRPVLLKVKNVFEKNTKSINKIVQMQMKPYKYRKSYKCR